MMEQHNDICFSSIKEVHYFSVQDLFKRGEDYFHSFYKAYRNEPVIAAADTYLMIDHKAIMRIHAYNPDMRILVMLRNPVDRAYSSYNYSVNYGHHAAYSSFLDSIKMEEKIPKEENIARKNNLGHFYAGLYHLHLSRWLEVFSPGQVFIMTTNELRDAEDDFAGKLFAFLGIPEQHLEISRENVQAVPRSKRLELFLLNRDHFLRRMIRGITPGFVKRWIFGSGLVDRMHKTNRKNQESLPLDPMEREKAMKYFREDLEMLEKELGVRV